MRNASVLPVLLLNLGLGGDNTGKRRSLTLETSTGETLK